MSARSLFVDIVCVLLGFAGATAVLPQPEACAPSRELPAAVARVEAR